MKHSGIIRRIDDLGRVVIPKETRRLANVDFGDPMEIFLTEDGILLKKYDIERVAYNHISALREIITELDEEEIDGERKALVLGQLSAIADDIRRAFNPHLR